MATRRRKPQVIKLTFKGAAATKLAAHLFVAHEGEKALEHVGDGPLADAIVKALKSRPKCEPWCGERCPNIGNPNTPCGHTEEHPQRWCSPACRDARKALHRQ